MAIDTSNITFIDYLWTKKNDDNTISGIRLSKNNLPTDTVYRGDIPAVNDGTLIIQKNGITVQTFTANQSSSVTANITVPTKTSDIKNDSGFLTSHQSIKNLNTNNNSVLNVASEAIAGSGSISLNGISKTAQEEYLQWGGPSKSGAVSPIGMTLSNEHSANRMAFINGDLITAEYSSDGGTTWTEYSANAAEKSQFFTKTKSFPIGRPTTATEITAGMSKTRITITAQDGTNPSGRVYTDPRKMLVLVSSATSLELVVEYRSGTNYKNNGAWSTQGTYTVSGWSGWNDIPLILNTLGGSSGQLGNNWQLRFTFTVITKNTSYPKTAEVLAARIYGQNTWSTPSTMAENGHMYTFDMSKNVTFPAGISATNFTEGGTSLANKYLGKTAKAADADKLDGHDSTYYLNLDNINDGSTRKLANYVPKSLTSTKGDMIYASAANTPARLGIGSNGQFLSIVDGIPKWVNNPDTHNSHAIISGTKSDNSTQIKGSASSGDITLGDSGVTAGSYGDSASQTPGYGSTFNVPYITVNSKGIVIGLSSHTVKIPASDNTWRPVVDNLTSTATDQSLSANQGKVLKGLIDGKQAAGNYVTTDTVQSITAAKTFSTINSSNDTDARSISTGTNANSYFQSRKFRGEGDANTYYHAIDFGYANHDKVDFYEYGGIWNFWKNTTKAATAADDNLCLQIGQTYLKNKSYQYDWPNASGTLALKSDIPTVPTVNNATLTIQKNGSNVATFTANSATNTTANITVPTKISELTNDSNYIAADNGKIPTSYLPSYVDDVVEYASKSNFPSTGETGKIYIAKDTNIIYRWSGSAYVEISASLALGETSSTAYAGDKGKANATAISTLQGYFNTSGHALAAVSADKATKDADGNIIHSTYLTKTDASNTYVKQQYSYSDNNFTITSTNLVTSLQYKDTSSNKLSGIYIAKAGNIQFKAPNGLQVYYNDNTTAYDVLTTNNMVAITTSEIDEICK